jgi:large subunit ribosomal protein L37Ae
MAGSKNYGSVKRFGTRYGRTTRAKIAKVEENLKKKHVCPFCKKDGVKRVSSGVWECAKCGSKFTGKAYSFDSKKVQSRAQTEN